MARNPNIAARAANVHQRARLGATRLRRTEAFEEHNGVVTAVYDRRTGVAIQRLVDLERVEEVQIRPGGDRIITRRVSLQPLPSYREIKLEMDDGSFHVTMTSIEAIQEGLSQEDLEDMYALDLERWEKEGMEVSDRIANRKPVRIVAHGRQVV